MIPGDHDYTGGGVQTALPSQYLKYILKLLFSDAGNVDGEVDVCASFGGFCDDNVFQK